MLSKIQKLIFEIGALPMIICTMIIALCTLLFFFIFNLVELKAIIGFLGIIIGSGITALTSLLIARENLWGKFAVASLDKRLEAHQKAYRIWRRMRGAVQKNEVFDKVLEETDAFWESNCLYLAPEAREAFLDCRIRMYTHEDILRETSGDKETREIKNESMEIINRAGELLVKGVALPSLGEKEFKVGKST